MYDIDLTACSAIDIIKRSIVCHPSLFADAVKARYAEDVKYARREDTPESVYRSIMASANAAYRAIEFIEHRADADLFAKDMAAGIIALNIACKLQCLPPHVRTSAAVRAWEAPD